MENSSKTSLTIDIPKHGIFQSGDDFQQIYIWNKENPKKCLICEQVNLSGIVIEKFEFNDLYSGIILMAICKNCLQCKMNNISKSYQIGHYFKQYVFAIKNITKSINLCLCCKITNSDGVIYFVCQTIEKSWNFCIDYSNIFFKSDYKEKSFDETFLCISCMSRYAENLERIDKNYYENVLVQTNFYCAPLKYDAKIALFRRICKNNEALNCNWEWQKIEDINCSINVINSKCNTNVFNWSKNAHECHRSECKCEKRILNPYLTQLSAPIWTFDNHHRFPITFKQKIAMFMMCLKEMQNVLHQVYVPRLLLPYIFGKSF